MLTNDTWLLLLENLLKSGHQVSCRGRTTVELLKVTSTLDMSYPILTVIERKLNYKFMAAEALWILTGDSRVAPLVAHNKRIASWSDDGLFFQGAYGPMVVQQLQYVVDTLKADLSSRQAVLSIWRPNPRPSKDIPCTLAVQFLVREGKLHCLDTMRSSDTWLGWPYDVFSFCMLALFVCLRLRQEGIKVELGKLILTAGSQHLYEEDILKAQRCLTSNKEWLYRPVEPDLFSGPRDLLTYLEGFLKDSKTVTPGFLHEVQNYHENYHGLKTGTADLGKEGASDVAQPPAEPGSQPSPAL